MSRLVPRALRLAAYIGAFCSAAAAPAKTIVIFVEPMTLEKTTQVFETPGPDRFLMCMQPPSMSGCREIAARKRN